MPKIEPLPGVRYRADRDKWEAVIVLSYKTNGQPDKRIKKMFTTISEANEYKRTNDTAKHRGTLTTDSIMTVGAFAADWLKTKERAGRAAKTMHDYKVVVNKFITPYIGNVRLMDLRPISVKRWTEQIGQITTQRTVWGAKKHLSMILEEACRLELIPRNPANGVQVEKPTLKRAARWSREDAATMLAHCNHPETTNRVRHYVAVALMTGLSREEVLGLRWSDITWHGGTARHLKALKPRERLLLRSSDPHWRPGRIAALGRLEVRQVVVYVQGAYIIKPTPKNENRQRQMYFDGRTFLTLYWQRQEIQLLKAAAKTKWVENDLVFPSSHGTPFPEGRLRLEFIKLCEEAGVPVIQVNKTRATYNSVGSLDMRLPAKLMQDRMGHIDERTQLEYYQQVNDVDRRTLAFSPTQLYGSKSPTKPNDKQGRD